MQLSGSLDPLLKSRSAFHLYRETSFPVKIKCNGLPTGIPSEEFFLSHFFLRGLRKIVFFSVGASCRSFYYFLGGQGEGGDVYGRGVWI